MNRMHRLPSFLLALILLSACEKQAGETPAARLSLNALPASGLEEVHSLDLLVYRAGDGMRDAYLKTGGKSSLQVSVTRGQRLHWYLIANAPASAQLEACEKEETFLSSELLLSQAVSDGLVMLASGISPGSGEAILRPYACKITLQGLSVPWRDSFYPAPACILERVVLVNVRGSVQYGGIPSALADDLWYNPSRDDAQAPPLDGLLAWNGPVTIPPEGLYGLGISLFALPNPSEGDETGPENWTPRQTRMALQLRIDNMLQWYSVDLPALQAGTHYLIQEAVITGPGTSQIDSGMHRSEIAFTCTVVPWDTWQQDLQLPLE